MGKNNKKKKVLPLVSICTPTFNRRPFIPIMFQCFYNQTYPKNRIEWIIVDDGTDKIEDLVKEAKSKLTLQFMNLIASLYKSNLFSLINILFKFVILL